MYNIDPSQLYSPLKNGFIILSWGVINNDYHAVTFFFFFSVFNSGNKLVFKRNKKIEIAWNCKG